MFKCRELDWMQKMGVVQYYQRLQRQTFSVSSGGHGYPFDDIKWAIGPSRVRREVIELWRNDRANDGVDGGLHLPGAVTNSLANRSPNCVRPGFGTCVRNDRHSL